MAPSPKHSNASQSQSQAQSVYNTVAGRAIPIEPHDYQLEGICNALDGVDVVATMATGAGKTGRIASNMVASLSAVLRLGP